MKVAFNDKYDYVDIKPISSGSFGNVYLIRDKKLKTGIWKNFRFVKNFALIRFKFTIFRKK